MAVKTVTNDNLSEYVEERKARGSQLATPAEVSEQAAKSESEGPTPGNPVITSGEEKSDDAPPDPGKQEPTAKARANVEKAKAGTDPGVQKRIDELTREKSDLESFAQEEYESRVRAEKRISELQEQVESLQPKETPKEPELKQPDPKDYTDNTKFLEDYAAYVENRAAQKFRKEQEEIRQRELREAQDKLLRERIELARKSIEDFDSVIESTDRRNRVNVPAHVTAAIVESEYGPHIAYHLAKNPDEEKRIFGMTPAKALLELGKIEEKYAKPAEPAKAEQSQPTKIPETTRAPAPVSKLKADVGIVNTDLTSPMKFSDYKTQRLQQIRERRRNSR